MAMTPRRRSSADSESSLLSAPRSLNEAVNCRFSNLRNTCAPVRRESVRLCTAGVCSTAPAMRVAAERTSSIEIAWAMLQSTIWRMDIDAGLARNMAAGEDPSDEQFRLLVGSLSDYAVCLLDAAGRVASWNSGAARTLGFAAEEVLGQDFCLFYAPEERAAGKPQAALERAEREGRSRSQGWRQRRDRSEERRVGKECRSWGAQ